jgi:hypothetical protein
MHGDPRFIAEPLEGRVLLDGTTSWGNGLTFMPQINYQPGVSVPDGESVVVSGFIQGNIPSNAQPGQTEEAVPTGSVTLQWYQGAVLATLPLSALTQGNLAYGVVPTTTITLTKADAGTPVINRSFDGPIYLLEINYTGDSNYAATPSFTSADFATAETTGNVPGNLTYLYEVYFSGSGPSTKESKTAFIQSPENTATGDAISPPVTVALEDNSGNIVTNSTSTVSLAITGSTTATLSGTTSVAAVNGIAKFSNLSINQPGSYTLTATSGSDTSAISRSFTITAGKLVILNAPARATAGEPIHPGIIVELKDGKGKIETSDSTTVVTLSPIGFTSGNPITGNSQTLVNGIATFSNVVLTKPGTYQLQAADGGDATAATKPFKVSGDKLVFKPGPKDTDVDQPLTFTVEAINQLGRIDTASIDSVQVSLNIISGGTGAVLAGTLMGSLSGGILTFSTAAGVSINTAGTYTLSDADLTSSSVAPQTSTQFKINALHLEFYNVSKSVDYGDPIPVLIKLLDSANHPVTTGPDANDSVNVLLNSAGGINVLGDTGTLAAGNATLSLSPGNAAPPGTYSLTAGTTNPEVGLGLSRAFKIVELHLGFYGVPKTVDFGDEIQVSLALLDSTNHRVTTGANANSLPTVSIENSAGTSVRSDTVTLKNGYDNLTYPHPPGGYPPGIYSFGAALGDPGVAPGFSPTFTIVPLHLHFKAQPSGAVANSSFSLAVELLDSKGRLVSTGVGTTDEIVPAFSPMPAGTITPTSALVNGEYIASYRTGGPIVSVPGTYTVTYDAYFFDSTTGGYTLDDGVLPVTSKPFKVLPAT